MKNCEQCNKWISEYYLNPDSSNAYCSNQCIMDYHNLNHQELKEAFEDDDFFYTEIEQNFGIKFFNASNNHNMEWAYFETHEDAVEWGKENLYNYFEDMIHTPSSPFWE